MISILIIIGLYILQKIIEKKTRIPPPISSDKEMIRSLTQSLINSSAKLAHSMDGYIKGGSLWSSLYPNPEGKDIDAQIPGLADRIEELLRGLELICSVISDSNRLIAKHILRIDEKPTADDSYPDSVVRYVLFVTLVFVDNSSESWMFDFTDMGNSSPVFVNGILKTWTDPKGNTTNPKLLNKQLMGRLVYVCAPMWMSYPELLERLEDFKKGIIYSNPTSSFFNTTTSVCCDERLSALRRFRNYIKSHRERGQDVTPKDFPFEFQLKGKCQSPLCGSGCVDRTGLCLVTPCCGKNICIDALLKAPRDSFVMCPFSSSHTFHPMSLTLGDSVLAENFFSLLKRATRLYNGFLGHENGTFEEKYLALMELDENKQEAPAEMDVDHEDDEIHIVVTGRYMLMGECGNLDSCSTCASQLDLVYRLYVEFRRRNGKTTGLGSDYKAHLHKTGRVFISDKLETWLSKHT